MSEVEVAMAIQQIEMLREMKARRPFASFKVVTATGESHLMTDRFQFAVGPDRALLFPEPGTTRWIALNASQIVSVEKIDERSAA